MEVQPAPFWLYIVGLTRATASLAGLFLNLIPIFGVSSAYFFLGERLSLSQWGGAIIIPVAVTLIVRLQRPAAVPLPETLPAA